jgi:hypothetical protein
VPEICRNEPEAEQPYLSIMRPKKDRSSPITILPMAVTALASSKVFWVPLRSATTFLSASHSAKARLDTSVTRRIGTRLFKKRNFIIYFLRASSTVGAYVRLNAASKDALSGSSRLHELRTKKFQGKNKTPRF